MPDMPNSFEDISMQPSPSMAENLFAKLEAAFRTKEIHLKKIALRPELLASRLADFENDPAQPNRKTSL
jgi:hypothetical protein